MSADRKSPGDGLLDPIVVGAIFVLLANDHWWKDRWPGLVTGKVSDVAGLVFFPLLAQALVEVAHGWAGAWPGPSRRALATCLVITGVVFAAAKLVPGANEAVEAMWGWIRDPLEAAKAAPTVMVLDRTDLVALPALAAAWLLGRRRCTRPCSI
jgi:hypothetical protein